MGRPWVWSYSHLQVSKANLFPAPQKPLFVLKELSMWDSMSPLFLFTSIWGRWMITYPEPEAIHIWNQRRKSSPGSSYIRKTKSDHATQAMTWVVWPPLPLFVSSGWACFTMSFLASRAFDWTHDDSWAFLNSWRSFMGQTYCDFLNDHICSRGFSVQSLASHIEMLARKQLFISNNIFSFPSVWSSERKQNFGIVGKDCKFPIIRWIWKHSQLW